MRLILLTFASWLVCVLVTADCAQWYVDGSVWWPGDGSTWQTAFNTIQEGINAASHGDEVIVAVGTYPPIDFRGKAITVHSTDPANTWVVEETIIHAQGSFSAPARAVTFNSGEGEDSVLSGFTITGGWIEAEPGGSGILCDGSSPTIMNNIVRDNIADGSANGAGVYCENSSARIADNIIRDNGCDYGHGGGVYCLRGSPTISGNTISSNAAMGGGGIETSDSAATIVGNTVSRNGAENQGAGILCSGSAFVIEQNIVRENVTDMGSGGGICCAGDENARIVNNTVFNNQSGSSGGGVFCSGSLSIMGNRICGNSGSLGAGVYCENSNDVSLINNTIVGNTDSESGGGVVGGTLLNCIVWGNSAFDGSQLYESTAMYSCVEGGYPGEGNTADYPEFADPDGPDNNPNTYQDNDYRLQTISPCIDAGQNEQWMWDGVDLDGKRRILYGRISLTVDMGAYEYGISGDSWYVDDSVAQSGDGTSWQTAFKTIQEGINASWHGDEVIVAEGTYLENIMFTGKNITLRSTYPGNPNVVGRTIIDGRLAPRSVVTFSGPENQSCTLAGFKIMNGSDSNGGGICGKETKAAIWKNIIMDNSAKYGGGLHRCDGYIEENAIYRNTASADGGGLHECHGTIQNNRIVYNSANGGGGGLASCGGDIRTNYILDNSASQGGGLWRCTGRIRINLIASNSANVGGGVCGPGPELTNNTIVHNVAWSSGGGIANFSRTILNCIIWRNSAQSDPQLEYDLQNPLPTYCCIQDWTHGGQGTITADPLFADPNGPDNNPGTYFDNIYRLSPNSPCIGTGLLVDWMENALDLEGKPLIPQQSALALEGRPLTPQVPLKPGNMGAIAPCAANKGKLFVTVLFCPHSEVPPEGTKMDIDGLKWNGHNYRGPLVLEKTYTITVTAFPPGCVKEGLITKTVTIPPSKTVFFKLRCDTTQPVITFPGGNSLTLEYGTEYVEPEFTATDNDIDISGELTVTGSVDPNIPGKYEVHYEYTDSCGNHTKVTLTVTVEAPPLVPVIHHIDPDVFGVSKGEQLMTICGEGFVKEPPVSEVLFRRGGMMTWYWSINTRPGGVSVESETKIEARPMLSSPGKWEVKVRNLHSLGDYVESEPFEFYVVAPVIDLIDPSFPGVSKNPQMMIIYGGGFVPPNSDTAPSKVFFGRDEPSWEIPLERTPLIESDRICVMPKLNDEGTWRVMVSNVGKKNSNVVEFEVKKPKITRIDPSPPHFPDDFPHARGGKQEQWIKISGEGFVPSDEVLKICGIEEIQDISGSEVLFGLDQRSWEIPPERTPLIISDGIYVRPMLHCDGTWLVKVRNPGYDDPSEVDPFRFESDSHEFEVGPTAVGPKIGGIDPSFPGFSAVEQEITIYGAGFVPPDSDIRSRVFFGRGVPSWEIGEDRPPEIKWDRICVRPRLNRKGTWRVMVSNGEKNSNIHEFKVFGPTIGEIYSLSPGPRAQKQWIGILGKGFLLGCKVYFGPPGQETAYWLIPPERTHFRDSTRIDVQATLKRAGEWVVQVKHPEVGESLLHKFEFPVDSTMPVTTLRAYSAYSCEPITCTNVDTTSGDFVLSSDGVGMQPYLGPTPMGATLTSYSPYTLPPVTHAKINAASGDFVLSWEGVGLQPYVVEVSDDLQNWFEVTDIIMPLVDGPVSWRDFGSREVTCRFYRLVLFGN